MNKQYIKRQFTLHKLGIPMTEKVKEYYDYFHHLIGNINDLEKFTDKDYPDSIFWRKDGDMILEYETEKEFFWVEHYTIWKKFEEKYILSYKDTSNLLECILEEVFKLKVSATLDKVIWVNDLYTYIIKK